MKTYLVCISIGILLGSGCVAAVGQEDQADEVGANSEALGSLLITSAKGTTDAATALTVCAYNGDVSDTGSGSYTLEVSTLSATNKARLETAIANRTATAAFRAKRYLDSYNNAYGMLTYSYVLSYQASAAATVITLASGTVDDDDPAGGGSGAETSTYDIYSVELATAGVPSTLPATAKFTLSFTASVTVFCKGAGTNDQAAASTSLVGVYGDRALKITGSY